MHAGRAGVAAAAQVPDQHGPVAVEQEIAGVAQSLDHPSR
jgi:hypothetical protein